MTCPGPGFTLSPFSGFFCPCVFLFLVRFVPTDTYFMSLGLLATLMGIDSGASSSACWQFAEGLGLAGGGAGRAAAEGLGWQETQDLLEEG